MIISFPSFYCHVTKKRFCPKRNLYIISSSIILYISPVNRVNFSSLLSTFSFNCLFYYAILFLIFIFCQYLVHIFSHNAQPQLNDSVFFVKSFTILKRVDKAIRTAMISLSTLIIYICFIINLLHFSSQHTGCIFEKLFHL